MISHVERSICAPLNATINICSYCFIEVPLSQRSQVSVSNTVKKKIITEGTHRGQWRLDAWEHERPIRRNSRLGTEA
jgi:hypothetical protein